METCSKFWGRDVSVWSGVDLLDPTRYTWLTGREYLCLCLRNSGTFYTRRLKKRVRQEFFLISPKQEFMSRQKYNMNVSFDEEKENNSCCDSDLYKQPPFFRKKATLGSFVKDRSKEHLLKAIHLLVLSYISY
jgi:hypothetical protein